MTFAKSERAAMSDTLDKLGPDAPTLCGGWDAHDLAAHLWIRENDPVGASGFVVKPLTALAEHRMSDVKQRWDFIELVDRIRRGPARFSFFSLPGVDDATNSVEFFVHHEDIRRAGAAPETSRELAEDVEDFLWRRLKLLARAFFKKAPVGVVLERLGSAGIDRDPETIRAASGTPIVTVVGRPGELMLYAFGRAASAEVKLVGEPGAIQRFAANQLNH